MDGFSPNNVLNVDAAPLESVRQPPIMLNGKRLRRRGPRSKLAVLRRSLPKHCRTLPDMSPGESGDVISEPFFEDQSHNVIDENVGNQIWNSNSKTETDFFFEDFHSDD